MSILENRNCFIWLSEIQVPQTLSIWDDNRNNLLVLSFSVIRYIVLQTCFYLSDYDDNTHTGRRSSHIERIARNNVRCTHLTSWYVESCQPLGECLRSRYARPIYPIKEIDFLPSSHTGERSTQDYGHWICSEVLTVLCILFFLSLFVRNWKRNSLELKFIRIIHIGK